MKKYITLLFILIPLCTWLAYSQTGELEKSMARGKDLYVIECMNCHMENGEGVEDLYPPLAKSDYMLKDQKRSIRIILEGQKGEVVVNEKTYNVDMPEQSYLTDEKIADILNYCYNSWGNKGKMITPEMVKAERNAQK